LVEKDRVGRFATGLNDIVFAVRVDIANGNPIDGSFAITNREFLESKPRSIIQKNSATTVGVPNDHVE